MAEISLGRDAGRNIEKHQLRAIIEHARAGAYGSHSDATLRDAQARLREIEDSRPLRSQILAAVAVMERDFEGAALAGDIPRRDRLAALATACRLIANDETAMHLIGKELGR